MLFGFGEPLRVIVSDDEAGALSGHMQRTGFANAQSGTGNQGRLAGKSESEIFFHLPTLL